MFRALLAALRRFFSRLRARRLIARQLPRGLAEVRLALRAPAGEPPPGEFWTPPLAGRPPARLLRLSALPPPPAHLAVVQPRKLRLDAEVRVPPELEPPKVPSAPAQPLRRRPRRPLQRAPDGASARRLGSGPAAEAGAAEGMGSDHGPPGARAVIIGRAAIARSVSAVADADGCLGRGVSGMEPPVGPPRDHAAESLQLPFALEPPDVFLADRLLIQDAIARRIFWIISLRPRRPPRRWRTRT